MLQCKLLQGEVELAARLQGARIRGVYAEGAGDLLQRAFYRLQEAFYFLRPLGGELHGCAYLVEGQREKADPQPGAHRLRIIACRDEVGENAADDPDAVLAEARVRFGGAGDTAEPGDGFWMVRGSIQQLSRDT